MVGSLGKKEGKVGDYFEKKGKDSSRSGNEPSSNGDSDKTLDKAVSWGRQVRARMDDHSKRTRLQRLISYNVAIVWSFLLLIFFNFFHLDFPHGLSLQL